MKGDFHMHTTYSDGVFSVEEVLEDAKNKNLDYISITDHDTLEGSEFAKEIEDRYGVHVVVGFEFSTYYKNESIHILSYFSNTDNLQQLREFLVEQREKRAIRAMGIKQKLKDLFDIDLDMTELMKISSITRGSIASEIIRQGFPYSRREIFEKMIGNDSPAYIPATKIPTKYAIQMIKDLGGVTVLAHPVHLKNVKVEEIIGFGVEGIEAIYSINKPEDTKRFKKIAKKHGLFFTAGSDFHMPNDYKHGNIGDVVLEGEDLERFLKKMEIV